MTRHRVPNHVLDGEDGGGLFCPIDVGCILEKDHEGACDLRAALTEPPNPGRPMTIREEAEVDALTLPPHLRPAAVERMVAERTAAATQRGIEKALEDQVIDQLDRPAWQPKVRVEIPANLRPQETNVFVDNIRLAGVVAVRVQTRPDGAQDTYVVLRVHDAEIKMAEGFADLEFGRLDLSVRQVRGFDVGTSMDSRQPVGMDYARRQLEG